jgi:hypothetical protein
VRHRVLESKLGRWTERSLFAYLEGAGLYIVLMQSPLATIDSYALMRSPSFLSQAAARSERHEIRILHSRACIRLGSASSTGSTLTCPASGTAGESTAV